LAIGKGDPRAFWYNFGHRKGKGDLRVFCVIIILAIGKGDPIVKNRLNYYSAFGHCPLWVTTMDGVSMFWENNKRTKIDYSFTPNKVPKVN
jgi:hypothetical protein